VPIILVTKEKEFKLSDGILADVAPTILDRLRLAAPIEMTGRTLVINNQ
jgi:2,3-bisphosphoglycerate-independent phosphoglycerate mutase